MTSLADDPLASVMRKYGVDPITREDYIDMAWGNEPPEPWTIEHELELPDELRDLDKVNGKTAEDEMSLPASSGPPLAATKKKWAVPSRLK